MTVTAERTCGLTPMPIVLPISVTLTSDVKPTEYLYPPPDQTRIEGHVEFPTAELIAMGATTVSGALDADLVNSEGIGDPELARCRGDGVQHRCDALQQAGATQGGGGRRTREPRAQRPGVHPDLARATRF